MSISLEESVLHPSREGGVDLRVKRVAGRSRWTLVAGAAVVVVGLGGWWWKGRGPRARYVTAPIGEGPVLARVTANGTIAARVTVQVGSQVSGRIQEIFVDFNVKVARGQVLARLDGELFRATVAQARANLMAAHGNLIKARAQADNAAKVLARARALAAHDLIAGADVDRADAEAAAAGGETAAAQGGVAQAQAALRQAQTNLAYTTIVSPVDGVVISRNVDVGQTVAASLQAPTLFTIAQDLRTMQVHTNVPEADVGKLEARSKATFTVDAFPEEHWNGVVREIRNASQVSQNVVTYDAVVDVENRGSRLRPGMTATVSFEVAERARVALIPNAALRYQPRKDDRGGRDGKDSGKDSKTDGVKTEERARSGRRPVYVLVNGAPERRVVKLGISDGKVTELVEGEVRPGDPIIIDERGDDDKRDDGKRDGTRRLPSRL